MHPYMLPSTVTGIIKYRTLLLSLLVISILGLSACGSETHPTQKNSVLQVALQDGPFVQNFNPYSPTALTEPGRGLIYETLLFINGQQGGVVTPWLATGYQFSAYTTMLTFKLRPGVEWSDGQPFSSADVVFTLNLLKHYPALDIYGIWAYLKNVAAPNAGTVVVTLRRSYSPILWYLGGQTPILSQHHWTNVGDPTTYADAHPVGTGPLVLTSFTPQLIALTKNLRYWQPGKPEVSAVHYQAFNSNTSAELSLEQGQIDWAGIDTPDLQQNYVARDPLHNHYWAPSNYLFMLYLNLDTYPFNVLPVRQAISLAIDRQQLARIGESGSESPANPAGIVLPAFQNALSTDYARASFTVDTARAQQLLQRVGFTRGSDGIAVGENGKKLAFSMNVVKGFTNWVNDCQIMAEGLRQIGISVSINLISYGAWYSALQMGDYEMSVGWTNPGPSAFFIFDGLLNSANTAPPGKLAPSNWERWRAPTSDSLLNEYASTTDPTVQRQAITGLEKIMVEQVPAIALLNGAIYSQYSTAHFTGWPGASDPYALAHPVDSPDNEITLLHLQPVG